jgi:LPXTG-motif cell wall-anchored protein
MSLTRKLFAIGLPAAGITAVAALALGLPASAAPAVHAAPALAALEPVGDDTGMVDDTRGGAGYYGGDTGNGSGNGADDEGPIRGDDDGYGGVDNQPSPSNSPNTPGGPGGPAPATTQPGGVSPDEVPNGVSPGSAGGEGEELPLTGTPTLLVSVVGGLLIAAGALTVLAVRRRRA